MCSKSLISLNCYLFLSLFCFACNQSTHAHTTPQSSPVLVSDIEAYLFHARKGEFSQNVFSEDSPALGNTVIGKDASQSTFVRVELTLTNKIQRSAKTSVRLLVTETASKKIILDEKLSTRLFNKSKQTYLGYWLKDTGCTPLTLNVNLPDYPEIKPIIKQLAFSCYE